MREAEKSKRIWSKTGIEFLALKGKGIDIGCSDSPILPDVRCFDMKDGDANFITQYVKEEFDFVYSSHCLEHMLDPKQALTEWWKLVKKGGYLFFTVPDEDLYEQGVFPSRFNSDHKHTFTVNKEHSWSPVSVNVLDLAQNLPGGEIVSLITQNNNYREELRTFGPRRSPSFFIKTILKLYHLGESLFKIEIRWLQNFLLGYQAVDQTLKPDTLAQIQCIIRKKD